MGRVRHHRVDGRRVMKRYLISWHYTEQVGVQALLNHEAIRSDHVSWCIARNKLFVKGYTAVAFLTYLLLGARLGLITSNP